MEFLLKWNLSILDISVILSTIDSSRNSVVLEFDTEILLQF